MNNFFHSVKCDKAELDLNPPDQSLMATIRTQYVTELNIRAPLVLHLLTLM